MSKLHLPANPTLKDFQKYVDDMTKERGFDKETLQEIMILLTEEVGEMARIIRKSTGIKTYQRAHELDAGEELADLLIYVLHLSNKLGINLEQAFRDKEEKNKKRVWV